MKTILQRISALRSRKAISHHPDLANRIHISTQSSGVNSGGFQSEIDSFIDYAKVYSSYVWVRKAIGKIVEAISPLPVRVVDKNSKAIEDHPLSILFGYVNDNIAPSDLWQSVFIQMLLAGESFLELVPNKIGNKIVEIWNRRPDQVSIIPDISRPLYPCPAGYKWREEEYKRDEVIHFRFYNPLNQWRGLAPIAAARAGITIDIFAQAWSKSFLLKGARPDFALVAPAGLTSVERDEYKSILMD